jgi:hypothetical protein
VNSADRKKTVNRMYFYPQPSSRGLGCEKAIPIPSKVLYRKWFFNPHLMAFSLKSKGSIDDKTFGTPDAQVGVKKDDPCHRLRLPRFHLEIGGRKFLSLTGAGTD